ncbi:hypothetical protein KC573_00675 [candidate division WWE3 bacterium]|uniref:Uncharacterized protein n=1 Tax=candidate division WWE3 bacterium TaxID=2053526 RepID=A0A955RWQ0_UNCKA|nr:hypothetical protein [candidate division WWE3 bacterium]
MADYYGPIKGPIHVGSGKIVRGGGNGNAGAGKNGHHNAHNQTNSCTTIFHGPVNGQVFTGDGDVTIVNGTVVPND